MRFHAGPVFEVLVVLSAIGGCARTPVREWERLDSLRGQPLERQADLLIQIMRDTPPEWHEGFREARPALVNAALERGHLEPLRRILRKQEVEYPIFGTVAFELARRRDDWTFDFLIGVSPPAEGRGAEKSFNHDGIRAAAVGALSCFLSVKGREDAVGNRLIQILRTDPSPDVRMSCTLTLATCGTPESADALREALKDAGQPSLPKNYRILYTVGDSAREALQSIGANPRNVPRP